MGKTYHDGARELPGLTLAILREIGAGMSTFLYLAALAIVIASMVGVVFGVCLSVYELTRGILG